MGSLAQGGFDLGTILAVGGRIRQDAQSAEEKRLVERAALQAETDRKVDLAREEMLKRTNVESFNNNETVDPLIRALTVGGLGSDYSGATQGRLHDQEFNNRAAAVTAALAGHADEANANLVGVAKGPLKLTEVQGGQVIRNPYSTTGSVAPTGQAQAAIEALQALRGEREAHAGVYAAQSAAGGFKPSAAGAGKPGKFTDPSVAAMAGIDPVDFALFRHSRPDLTDGAEAASAYRAAMPTGPHIIDPSHPGSMTLTPPNLRDQEAARLADGTGRPMDELDAGIADVERRVGHPLTPQQAAVYRAGGNVPMPGAEPNVPPPPAAVLQAAAAAVHPAVAALRGHAAPPPHVVGHVPVPPAAVEYLRANPHLRAAFAAKYGSAAAASILDR